MGQHGPLFRVLTLLITTCATAQDANHRDPYQLKFEDFDWTKPANLQPLTGAVSIGEPIDLGAAMELLERRISNEPNDFSNRTILGQLLLQYAKQEDELSAYVASETMLRAALKINPSYQSAQLALAMTLMARHQFSEASELAKRLNEESPDRPATLAVLFDTQLELGDYAQAKSTLAHLQTFENSAPVLARAARLHELKGARAKAIELIDEAIDNLKLTAQATPTEMAWYQWRKATLLLDSGKPKDAQQVIEMALESAPDDEANLVCLASAQFALGDLQAAARTLESAAASEAPPAIGLLGDVRALQGDRTTAELLWSRTEELMRKEAKLAKVAHAREVAMFYADHNRNLLEALQLSALDMNQREDAFAWDAQAWVLFKNGRLEDAQTAMRTALAMVDSDCRMLFHAAMIDCASGDVASARVLVQQITKVNPNFSITYSDEFKQLLNQLDLQP